MQQNQVEGPRATRREALKTVIETFVVLPATGCLIARTVPSTLPEKTTLSPKIPTATPLPTKVPEETPIPAEKLPAKFDKAIAQAEILAKEFPDEFAEAASLKEDLLELKRLNRLIGTPVQHSSTQQVKLASVDAAIISENGAVQDLYPVLNTPDFLFTAMSPIEQVMILVHEMGHYKSQQKLLAEILVEIKGQPNNPQINSKINQALRRKDMEEESRELYKNCRQLFAMRTRSPSLKLSPYAPWDQPLPNSLDRTRTLYRVYLDVKNSPDPEEAPRWKAAVQNFILR